MADPDDYYDNYWPKVSDDEWPKSDRFYNLCNGRVNYSMTQSQILQMFREVRELKKEYYWCCDELEEQYQKEGDLQYDMEQLESKIQDDASTLAATKAGYESQILELWDQINNLTRQRHEDATSLAGQYTNFCNIIEVQKTNYLKETHKLHLHILDISRQYDSLNNFYQNRKDKFVESQKDNELLRKENLALKNELQALSQSKKLSNSTKMPLGLKGLNLSKKPSLNAQVSANSEIVARANERISLDESSNLQLNQFKHN